MTDPAPPAARKGSLEEVPLRRGTGRIAAVGAVFFGLLSLLGALCFHFPEYLTTPELRRTYNVPMLRGLLLFGMLASVGFGAWTFYRGRARRWAGRWPEKYGVVGKPLPHGFVAQHLYPFIKPLQERETSLQDREIAEKA